MDCSYYPLSDEFAYKCVNDDISEIYACKEVLKYNCSNIPQIPDDRLVKCFNFHVSINLSERYKCLGSDDDSK